MSGEWLLLLAYAWACLCLHFMAREASRFPYDYRHFQGAQCFILMTWPLIPLYALISKLEQEP